MIKKKKELSLVFFVLLVFCCNDFAYGNSFKILKCKYCDKKISGRYVTQNNKAYHEVCYREHIQLKCNHCNIAINGEYNIEGEKNYHKKCFRNFILEKCDICLQPIDDLFVEDNYGNTYHNYHRSTMPLCESCNRIISRNTTDGGVKINKERNICNLCFDYVIRDNMETNAIYKDIRKQLNSLGIENIPKEIPIRLVDSKNDLQKISKTFFPNGLQGYTKYDYQKIGKKKINENYTIFILSNLHEISFRAVLAHELLHVYLFNNNIALRKSLVEGFCNLGSEHVYRSFPENKIAKLKLESMFKDDDPEYGKGFRIMSSELESIGWKDLLNKLRQY